jgi:4-diphosphocytidyl-2-C-methyl-D-erythritol kinase
MITLSVRSFAKLNIALDVLDKRPDGYHNIESVIQPISLEDRLIIRKRDDADVLVRASNPNVPSGKGNLVYTAAVFFLEASGLRTGVEIEIEKNIPMQAGLGGGSSNAAAAIVGMNELFGHPLGEEQMLSLCARLGSDVPFFLRGGTAFVSGRGEVATDIADASLEFVVVKPEFGISTAWAYGCLSAQDRRPIHASREVAEAIRLGSRERLVAAMNNDFGQVAESAFPQIGEIQDRLKSLGADGAMLAGSGSAVFGAFLDANTCDLAFEAIREEYSEVFRARTLLREELSPEDIFIGQS